jgi:hypothetical protein
VTNNKVQSITEFLNEDAVEAERKRILKILGHLFDLAQSEDVKKAYEVAMAVVSRGDLVPVPPPAQGEI